MEYLLVIIFDNQPKALEGWQILRDLDKEGAISLYDVHIIAKEPSGAARVVDNADLLGLDMIAGSTAIGALVGVLAGPVGALVGGASGALIGYMTHARDEGVTDEFVSDITKALTPGKVALVTDIDEESITPLDIRMEAIGGIVFRRVRSFVKDTQEDLDASAYQAQMKQLEAERERANADRWAKIDAKIDQLRAKRESAIQRKRHKMQLREQERDAKIRTLQIKADRSQGEARRRQEARIAELKRVYEEKVGIS